MRTGKPIWLSLIATLILIGITMLFVDTVPPHSMTHGSMHMCKRRVLRYAYEHGKLPSALSETEPIEGFLASTKDGWGVVLDYSVDTNDVVTFKSLGKDRAVGGVGDNADMIGVFHARQPDGSWSSEFVDWTQDPFYALSREKPNQALDGTSAGRADASPGSP